MVRGYSLDFSGGGPTTHPLSGNTIGQLGGTAVCVHELSSPAHSQALGRYDGVHVPTSISFYFYEGGICYASFSLFECTGQSQLFASYLSGVKILILWLFNCRLKSTIQGKFIDFNIWGYDPEPSETYEKVTFDPTL